MPARPRSIEQFNRVYLAVIVLGLIGVAIGWRDMMASVAVQRQVAQGGMAMVIVPILVVLLVQVALWYFVVRRGSAVAKWIFVVVTLIAIASSGIGLFTGLAANAVAAVIDVASIILQAIAILLILDDDARGWFERPAGAA